MVHCKPLTKQWPIPQILPGSPILGCSGDLVSRLSNGPYGGLIRASFGGL